MTTYQRLIGDIAGRTFSPPRRGRSFRASVFRGFGHGIIFSAAMSTSGFLEVSLWIWLAWRIFGLLLGSGIGGDVMALRERRLRSLPMGWRDFLITGKQPDRTFRYVVEYPNYPGNKS
jgi:hypothetical protein